MDASFEPTFAGGGFGEGEMDSSVSQFRSSTNPFDRVPLPVSIEEVATCDTEDDKIQYGSYSFGMLRVCGRIIEIDQSDKDLKLVVCDPSETNFDNCIKLNVTVYSSAHTGTDFNQNDIIIALGKMRKFGGMVVLLAFGAVLVTDEQQIETFKLESQLAKLYYTKDLPERISQGPVPELEGTLFSNIPIVRAEQGVAATNATPAAPNASGQFPTNLSFKHEVSSSVASGIPGLSGWRERIYTIIRENCADENGIHTADIQRLLGQKIATFESDVQYLVNEGIIYQTVDEQHFAAI